ncbi:hypothetical protein POUND7_003647 [Theobroma cacao]
MNLVGRLSGDISTLSELQQVDLSYNKGLTGSLPASIGNLKNLRNLILVGCGFNGPIPDSIGSISQLRFLSLNSNGFTGRIPPSIGNLSNLVWLDLADNHLEGPIPVSNGSTPGLDMLIHTKHFHFGKNKLSGQIPFQLFSSDMTLIHLLFESNELTGSLLSTLGLVQTLEVVRFDNNSLNGHLPLNLNNLSRVQYLFLSNNKLTGPLPDLTGMNSLNTLYLGNNSFDLADVPSWFRALRALTTLRMEHTQLRGQVPASIFELPNLKTVVLKGNQLNGTLEIGPSFSNQLKTIDLQYNSISGFDDGGRTYKFDIILVDNPVCTVTETRSTYCKLPPSNSGPLFSTPPSKNCLPVSCSSDQISSTTCKCAHPYTGTLLFGGISFSDFRNSTPYEILEQQLIQFFQSHQRPVDSVSLSDPRMDLFEYHLLDLAAFRYGQSSFNRTGIFMSAFVLSNPTFRAPRELFGPYIFIGDKYEHFSAHWDSKKSGGSIPQLKGARCFSFEELKKYTNNFSEANDIGSGGYGKVNDFLSLSLLHVCA